MCPWGLAAVLICALQAPSDVRTWTDSSGKHKTEAELVDVTNGIVLLRKRDGEILNLRLEQLCESDQRFIAKSTDGLKAADGPALSLTKLAAKVERSVVQIQTHDSIGSGFVVGKKGFIITNYHVVEHAPWAKVTFHDGRFYEVNGVMGVARLKDLVVLRLNYEHKHPALPIRKTEPLKGESVAAFGAPEGLSFSVSEGIVSAIRAGPELEKIMPGFHRVMEYDPGITWVQTSAPISGGNSGGPLVDMQGRVVGINTWTRAGDGSQNLNFAVGWKDINQLLDNLSKTPLQPRGRFNPKAVAAEPAGPKAGVQEPETSPNPPQPSPQGPPLVAGIESMPDESNEPDNSTPSALDAVAITPSVPTTPSSQPAAQPSAQPKAPSSVTPSAPPSAPPGFAPGITEPAAPSIPPMPGGMAPDFPDFERPTRPGGRGPSMPFGRPGIGPGRMGPGRFGSGSPFSRPPSQPSVSAPGRVSPPSTGNSGTSRGAAYEPFEYSAIGAKLAGQRGGQGLSGNWSAVRSRGQVHENYVIGQGTLTYPGLPTGGNRVTTRSVTQMASLSRGIAGAVHPNSTRYFSFLVRPEGNFGEGAFNGFFGMYLNASSGSNIFVGASGESENYAIEVQGGSGRVSSRVKAAVGQTAFLVVKAELRHGSPSRFTLYVNPDPSRPEPRSGTVKEDTRVVFITGVCLFSTGAHSFDELRIGSTWADVMGAN